jgi:hypothetical protein
MLQVEATRAAVKAWMEAAMWAAATARAEAIEVAATAQAEAMMGVTTKA